MKLRFLAMTALCFGMAVASPAAPNTPPAGGVPLLPAHSVTMFYPQQSPDSSVTVISVKGRPFTQALRLVTRKKPTNSWDLQLVATTTGAVTKGDTLYATFWLRCPSAVSTGYGLTEMVFENDTTYNKSILYPATATSQWKFYQVPFTAVEDEPLGKAHLNFHMGFPPQTLELGGVTLTDYGPGLPVSALPQTPPSNTGN